MADTNKRIDNLVDLKLNPNGCITEELYTNKMQALKRYEAKLLAQLKQHTEADDTFSQSLMFVLKLAKNAASLFESSNLEQKRQILDFITSNLEIGKKKVHFAYKKPFDLVAKGHDVQVWYPQ